MRIGILIHATGKYTQFLPRVMNSSREAIPGVEFEIFSDSADSRDSHWPHLPWPMSTMLRYHAFVRPATRYTLTEKYDFLIHIDADMAWRPPLDLQFLRGSLVTCLHPGFEGRPRASFPYEKREKSACYIKPDEGTNYYPGGFTAGATKKFLEFSDRVVAIVNKDLQAGIIPVWHEESAKQRVMIDMKPDIVLKKFMIAEECADLPENKSIPLVALKKKHEEFQK